MYKKKIMFTLKALLIVMIPFILVGCFGHGNGQIFGKKERLEKIINWKFEDLMEKIDADQDQKLRLAAMKDNLIQELSQARESKQEIHAQLFNELQKDDPDTEQIHQLVDLGLGNFKIAAHKTADYLIEAQAVLLPEQKEKLAKLISEKHACLTSE